MEYIFSEEDIKNEKTAIELEEMVFKAEKIVGEGKEYVCYGDAIVEEEVYHNFQVKVFLCEETDVKSPFDILEAEWEDYDFLF